MTITVYPEVIQGSEEWFKVRMGKLTAGSMDLILTPTLKKADNEKTRSHIYELIAQRVTQYVEPSYISDDMLRGHADEIRARALYSERYAKVHEVGFVENDQWGFVIGYSPDGLVDDSPDGPGFIEAKSRRQKFQIQTVIENVMENTAPTEYMLQIQTGLLVTGRKWCDFISYSGGLPMATIRVLPDPKYLDAILDAARAAEDWIAEKMAAYESALKHPAFRLIPTERVIEEEII